ncbi:MAG: hypothetical protein OIF50_09555 [Flavobacteriaceae bacterium]|nr:hypothetical protein [Flavobacteriaceae bacterium]
MKRYIFCSLLWLFLGCTKEEDEEGIIGTWQLVALQNADGSLETIESNKVLVFEKNGRIRSNGAMCNFTNTILEQEEIGTYDMPQGSIRAKDCATAILERSFSYHQTYLLLKHPCNQHCVEKYERVEMDVE